MTATPSAVEIDVIVAAEGWSELDLEGIAARAAQAALARLSVDGPAEIALLATSDAEVAQLNADFRAKPTPTNVLSWPSQALTPAAPGAHPPPPRPDATGALALGDIALAYETCLREAQAGDKPLNSHTTHLIVHAILHLLGYDHMSEDDAALMERLEVEILDTLGLPDPYSGHAVADGGRSGAD